MASRFGTQGKKKQCAESDVPPKQVNHTERPAVATQLSLGAGDIPALVAYSDSKQRFAVLKGALEAAEIAAFLGGLLEGRVATLELKVRRHGTYFRPGWVSAELAEGKTLDPAECYPVPNCLSISSLVCSNAGDKDEPARLPDEEAGLHDLYKWAFENKNQFSQLQLGNKYAPSKEWRSPFALPSLSSQAPALLPNYPFGT